MSDIKIGDLVLNVNQYNGNRDMGMVVRKQNDSIDPAYEWWIIDWFEDAGNKIAGANSKSIREMKENLRLIYGK